MDLTGCAAIKIQHALKWKNFQPVAQTSQIDENKVPSAQAHQTRYSKELAAHHWCRCNCSKLREAKAERITLRSPTTRVRSHKVRVVVVFLYGW